MSTILRDSKTDKTFALTLLIPVLSIQHLVALVSPRVIPEHRAESPETLHCDPNPPNK